MNTLSFTHVPNHIGIIMDGNGRWAKEHDMPRTFGHQRGSERIREIITFAFKQGVKVVSLYAFSTENWGRPKEEVEYIMDLLYKGIEKHVKLAIKEKTKVVFSGDVSKLSEKLQVRCAEAVKKTQSFTEHIINFCINYGGRDELIGAFNQMIKDGVEVCTQSELEKRLYTNELGDVDLIIRTSGEQRISNFLLWQSAYAELYFTDVYWPDFNKKQLIKALQWYDTRKRRFGLL